MKRSLLLKAALGLSLLATGMPAKAQQAPKFQGNWHINYIDANFAIVAPASIAGTKKYTLTNNNSGGTTQWGRAIDSTWLNIPLVKAYDSLGISPLLNGTGSYPSLVGKFALIYRGTDAAHPLGITFSQKACYCQAAGAIGVIIVNNVPGDPIGMANTTGFCTVNIPVLMISNTDGAAINSALSSGQSVSLSLTGWQTGLQHDLSILKSGVELWHAYAIPFTQTGTGNGNPVAFKYHTGAFLANFGTSNETNVNLVSKVTFTPNGGATTQVYTDSIEVGSFPTLDSVIVPRTNTAIDIHPTGLGRYDANYKLTMASPDQSPGDNSQTATMYITDSIYSKSKFDFTKGVPVVASGYRIISQNAATDYVWGDTYYIPVGGYTAKKVQFNIVKGDTSATLDGLDPVNVLLFRWTDGKSPFTKDGQIQAGELDNVGVATKVFSTADSNNIRNIITLNWKNPLNASKPVVLKDTSWYYVAIDMLSSLFIGSDGSMNYYPRSYIRSHTIATGSKPELYAPAFVGNAPFLKNNPSNFLVSYPNDASQSVDSVAFFNQGSGMVPSIALHISTTQTSAVPDMPDAFRLLELYPNPASNELHIRVKLDKQASHVYLSIADGLGRTVSRARHDNLLQDDFSMNTSSLPAGQYYLIINADDNTAVRPFTIIK